MNLDANLTAARHREEALALLHEIQRDDYAGSYEPDEIAALRRRQDDVVKLLEIILRVIGVSS